MGMDVKKLFMLAAVCIMSISLFTGCEEEQDLITIDVYSSTANYQGIQGGWFGKIVEERFQIRLNIIAPNTVGSGDRLFETRVAAGKLGDIVMIGAENGRLQAAVDAGILLDLSPYLENMPNVTEYNEAVLMIQDLLGEEDAVYAIPSSVTSFTASEPSEGTEPTFGPYLRWDLYEAVGAPQMRTLEDLLTVLKAMQEENPISESGERTYAFSLFGDWDDNMMTLAKQPACFYGYDEVGFLLNKADGSDIISILDSDSPYVRSLHLYFLANQMGLLDPESRDQTWDDVWKKYQDGQIIYSPWPWLGQAAYNTVENLTEGRGFMLAPIDDMQIYSYGATPAGTDYVIAIGADAEDPERIAEFVDWLYSPEGIMYSTSQTGSTCGPEGLTWEMEGGEPVLTEFGIQAMLQGGAELPEEWGGGSWNDGISQLNIVTVLTKDINPENGFSYDFRYWNSYIEFMTNPVQESWDEEMDAISSWDYLKKNNQYIVAPGTDYIAKAEPKDITIARSQCKSIIVNTSWDMVYAQTEEEFYELLDYMQKTTAQLGYDKVIEFDMETATELNAARVEAANE